MDENERRPTDLSRRRFIQASLAGSVAAPLAAAGCQASARPASGSPPAEAAPASSGGPGPLPAETPPPVETVNGMPYRLLGKTGVKVSLLGVGGFNIASVSTVEDSIAIIRTALDEGVNFLDNAWEYHGGKSEEWMGRALEDGYRKKAFLMTKVCGRDGKAALSNLEDSLRRLRTDVIDLWQFHEINYDNDPEMVFAPEGAIHAAVKAREQGKVRFIGFTGHKSPHIHLKMLGQDFDWDSVQMPINVMDAHYRSFARAVLPVLVSRGIGAIAMKTAGGGAIVRSGKVTPAECLRYAMSLPVSTVVSGMDSVEMVRHNVGAAKSFKPFAPGEREDLLARVKDVAGDGRFERFKSTQDFDSRPHREQHGLL